MKVICLLLVGALLGGCESMSSRVSDRFTKVQPHTRIYPVEPRVVYVAAQQAVKDTGLLISRASAGEWTIKGYAPIRSGDVAQDARQTTIEIRLVETEELDTRVEVLVWENTAGSFPGGVSEQALAEHSLYQLYLDALQKVLEETGAIKSGAKS
jgi:hypothetical protein